MFSTLVFPTKDIVIKYILCDVIKPFDARIRLEFREADHRHTVQGRRSREKVA